MKKKGGKIKNLKEWKEQNLMPQVNKKGLTISRFCFEINYTTGPELNFD